MSSKKTGSLGKTVTTDKVNHLNSWLIIGSAFAAVLIPFELFLFAYAILGPLHYLTEISWLDKKGYFTERKVQAWVLVLLGAATVAVYALGGIWESYAPMLILAAVALAYAMQSKKSDAWFGSLGLLAVLAILTFRFDPVRDWQYIASVFILTIIHVFLFTAAFILYGSLKTKSRSGYLSLVIFLAAGAVMFLPWPSHLVSETVKPLYDSFAHVNVLLLGLLFPAKAWSMNDVFYSAAGISVMRFIAFSYTYHYLNWFSKTTVIRWHDVSKGRLVLIGFLWLLSLAFYFKDYYFGVKALFFLSLLHVFLEFPLNFRTFKGIGQELSRMVR